MPAVPTPAAPGRAPRTSLSGLPRAFWWLWTSTLINRVGGFVTTFLALYLTADRGLSASFAGLVAALYGAGGAIASVLAGVLADRVGRRATLLASQLATAVTMTALGLTGRPVVIAVLVCLLGATANASRPSVQAIIADLVPEGDRVRAFSLNYWAVNIGFSVASVAAGLIAEHAYLLLFLGNAASVLVCALVVYLKVPETRPTAPGPAPGAGPVDGPAPPVSRQGLAEVVRDGRFMAVVALCFLVGTVLMQYNTSLPVSMGESGFSSGDYGLVIGVNGLLVVVAQLPVARAVRARHPIDLLVVASLLCGYGFGLTVWAHSVPVYVLTVCVWTVGEIVHNPTSMALVAALSPAHSRGRYQGVYTLAWSAATLVSPLVGGVVIDRFGSAALWDGCTAVGTAAAVGYWLLRRPLGHLFPVAVPVDRPEEAAGEA